MLPAVLRRAFMDTMRQKEFLARAERAKLAVRKVTRLRRSTTR
jgi:hypothetical protein